MSDFLDKLNVLLRSNLNSFLSPDGTRRVPPEKLGKDIDREISALRGQIEIALNTEDDIKARIEKYQQQIDSFNLQADEAIKRGDDAAARQFVTQMHRQEQLQTMLHADLDDHRRATSELIERVNMLDAIVSDARRQKEEEAAQNMGKLRDDLTAAAEDATGKLSDLLRSARERVESAIRADKPIQEAPEKPLEEAPGSGVNIPIKVNLGTPENKSSDQKPKAEIKPNDKKVNDDLEKRRARLSKPD